MKDEKIEESDLARKNFMQFVLENASRAGFNYGKLDTLRTLLNDIVTSASVQEAELRIRVSQDRRGDYHLDLVSRDVSRGDLKWSPATFQSPKTGAAAEKESYGESSDVAYNYWKGRMNREMKRVNTARGKQTTP